MYDSDGRSGCIAVLSVACGTRTAARPTPCTASRNDHVAAFERVRQFPQQGRLAGGLAFARPACPFQHRAARQRHDGHQTRQWKAPPRLLFSALGKAALVGGRIGHRHRGAIDQLGLPAAPQPVRRLLAAQALPRLAADALDQAQGQPLPRLAIGAAVQTAGRLPQRHPRTRAARHRILAAVVRSQHLLVESEGKPPHEQD